MEGLGVEYWGRCKLGQLGHRRSWCRILRNIITSLIQYSYCIKEVIGRAVDGSMGKRSHRNCNQAGSR